MANQVKEYGVKVVHAGSAAHLEHFGMRNGMMLGPRQVARYVTSVVPAERVLEPELALVTPDNREPMTFESIKFAMPLSRPRPDSGPFEEVGELDVQELPPVGASPANYWGVYDLHGLIWEWVEDTTLNPNKLQRQVELLQGEWAALGADAARVRTEVFIEEQAIPKEMEWDEADATALHAIVRNRLGQPLATGRLLTEAPGVGRIGRMAVIRVMRGTQLGADVLKALLAAAWARGDREVVLSAQRSAAGFYSRLGFEERGPDFEEAGIAHVEMVRRR